MSSLPYIIQDDGITVFVNKQPHHVRSSSPKYAQVKEALNNKEWDKIESLISYGTAVSKFSQGKMKLEKGVVTYADKTLPDALSKRIVKMIDEEMDLDPIIKFVERLHLNPSFNSVQQTYAFLEKNMLPLTDDGYILAYKTVCFADKDSKEHNLKRGDLVDCYTRTMRNNIGDAVEMERNEVDDDPNNLCSFGLHAGSEAYYSRFGHSANSVMLVVKVDPADVVAVPKYHHDGKFRSCRYEVLSYFGNDGDKRLEDETVVSEENPAKSFDAKVDTRGQVQKALNVAKGMIDSYNRQRLGNQAGHWAAVAGWVGYLQGVKLDKYTIEEIADAIENEFGFMSAEVKDGNLYIVRA
tara:strand:+ start:1691 stop:2749 length:1059 start_codon:yes stop_codon:yes gene_type:complete